MFLLSSLKSSTLCKQKILPGSERKGCKKTFFQKVSMNSELYLESMLDRYVATLLEAIKDEEKGAKQITLKLSVTRFKCHTC